VPNPIRCDRIVQRIHQHQITSELYIFTEMTSQPVDVEEEWPPRLQSFEEYKAELDEAIEQCPPFGEWLRKRREFGFVNGQGRWASTSGFELSLEQLKRTYAKEVSSKNYSNNTKRAAIEAQLEATKAICEQHENDMAEKKEAYTIALDAWNKAKSHGYRVVPMPNPPPQTKELLIRNMLLETLNKLLTPPCDLGNPPNG
jgi:hypothetical protein